MAIPFLAVPLVLHLIASANGGVPNFDVRPSCRAAAMWDVTSKDAMQSCMVDEQNAHDQLVSEWTKFNAADRATCLDTMMEFEPTYTEVLTCLEMGTDGSGVSLTPSDQRVIGPKRRAGNSAPGKLDGD
jgi:hypothetical protein